MLNSSYCKIKHFCAGKQNKQLFFLFTLYLFCVLDVSTFRNLVSPCGSVGILEIYNISDLDELLFSHRSSLRQTFSFV